MRTNAYLFLIIMALPALSQSTRTWENLGQITTSNMSQIIWGSDRFLAIGSAGAAFYSLDGIDWLPASTTGAAYYSGAAYLDGWFYIMGAGTIQRSADGSVFHDVYSGSGIGLFNAMASSEGRLVVVGNNGKVVTSDNEGVTWTPRSSGVSKNLRAVVWWQGRFIACGWDHTIITSPDGIAWSIAYQDPGSGVNFQHLVAWGNQLYAFATNWTTFVSSNGTDWNISGQWGPQVGSATVENFGATFFGGGWNYSADGAHWIHHAIPDPFGTLYASASNGQTWVAVNDNGEFLVSKPNATHHWQEMGSNTDIDFNDVIWYQNHWIGVGSKGGVTAFVAHSFDGEHWTEQKVNGLFGFTAIAQDDEVLVAVGAQGEIRRSVDGFTWTDVTSNTANTLTGVAHNGIRWVAVGLNGTAVTSSNGTTWTVESTGTSQHLNAVIDHKQAEFWAVGDAGTVIYRTGGGNWLAETSPTSERMLGIASNHNSLIWMAGENGVAYRRNGSTWTQQSNESSSHITDVTWSPAHGPTFSCAEGAALIQDQNWFRYVGVPVNSAFKAVGHAPSAMLAVGDDGGCVASQPFPFMRPEIAYQPDVGSNQVVSIATDGSRQIALAASERAFLSDDDGRTWSQQQPFPSYDGLQKLIWNGTEFVALGINHYYLSNDGSNWSLHDIDLSFQPFSIAYNGSVYVLPGTFNIAYGSDLDNLNEVARPDANGNADWTGTHFIVYGDQQALQTSADGQNWQIEPLNDGDLPEAFATNGNVSVLVGRTQGVIWRSTNSVDWDAVNQLNEGLGDVIWDGEQFIAMGGSGKFFTSRDGIKWNEDILEMEGYHRALAWTGNSLLAGGHLSGEPLISRFLRSDGFQWGRQRLFTASDLLWGVADNGVTQVAVGGNGIIAISNNGLDWNAVDSGVSLTLRDVAWIGDRFLAVGSSGTVLSSPDGVGWTPQSLGATTSLNAVYWDGEAALVGGNSGKIYRSTNGGSTWTEVASLLRTVYAFASRHGNVVAVGFLGLTATSSDGVTWQTQSSGTTASLNDVCASKDGFLAVGASGTLIQSSNGVNWSPLPTFTSEILRVVCQRGQQTVISGVDGSWTSEDLSRWAFHDTHTGNGMYELIRSRDRWLGVGAGGSIWNTSWGISFDSPRIVSQSGDFEACLGAFDSISVEAYGPTTVGPGGIRFVWFKDNVEQSQTGSHFYFSNFSAADEGVYQCRAMTPGGYDESLPILVTLGTGYTGRIDQAVYVQGVKSIRIPVDIDCDGNPADIEWVDLTTMGVLGSDVNPLVLTNPYPVSSQIEVTVQDTVTLQQFQDQTFVLVSPNTNYFDVNGDNCNNLSDLHALLEDWGSTSTNDPSGNGLIDVADYVYINLSGDCL